MTKILYRLPIPTKDDVAVVCGEVVRIKAFEIVAWVSVSAKRVVEWDPGMVRFPAILDTGHTHNFSIREEHLIRWAGLHAEMRRFLGTIRQAGQHVTFLAANVWVHRN